MDINKKEVAERFGKVLAARKTGRELIQLYDRLAVSDKFTDPERPLCFGLLTKECARKVSGQEAGAMLAAIRRTKAMAKVRSELPEDESDQVAAEVVSKVLMTCTKDRNAVLQAITALEDAEVARDPGQVFGYGNLAGMSLARLDELCDLSFEPKVSIETGQIPF